MRPNPSNSSNSNNRRWHQLPGLPQALLAVLLWSTVATAFKLGLQELSPLQLLAGASLVSCAVLLLWLALSRRLAELAASPRTWLGSLAMGCINPGLYYLVLFAAYDRLPAQVAQPLNYTWAITMSLLAVPLLGQQLGRRQLLALVLAWCGVLVIATSGQPGTLHTDDAFGVALALGSTLLWALYWIFATRDPAPTDVVLTRAFLCGTPLVLLACALGPGLPFLPWQDPTQMAGTRALLSMVWIGLFEMGLTFLLWGTALQRSGNAAGISQLIFLSPFLSLVFISQVLDEPLRLATLPGLALIVGGLVIQARAQTTRVPAPADQNSRN